MLMMKCLLTLFLSGVQSFSSVPPEPPTVTSVSQSVPHLGDVKVVCDHSDKSSEAVSGSGCGRLDQPIDGHEWA